MRKTDLEQLPVIPLRDMVAFPGTRVTFLVGRPASVAAARAAVAGARRVLLVMQRDPEVQDPGPADLHAIGTIGRIVHEQPADGGNLKLLVEGLARARAAQVTLRSAGTGPGAAGQDDSAELLEASVESLSVDDAATPERQAARQSLQSVLEQHAKALGQGTFDAGVSLLQAGETRRACDEIASRLAVPAARKQELLEILDVGEALRQLEQSVVSEVERIRMEQRLQQQVRTQVEKAQREYLLNEKLKAIHSELGRKPDAADTGELEKKVEAAGISEAEAKERALQEVRRLEAMPPVSAEATVSRNYLDWLLALPWRKRSRERKDLDRAARILEEDHHGIEKAKERIVEFLAVRTLQGTKAGRGTVLCLVGPPGVGKTSLARSIARATGREFVRLSLGGVRDEAEIRGHRRTYVGAYPGRVIQMMRKAGTRNPVFLLDEIDKLASDFRGDPSAALLEVLDPESSATFLDHYLDTPFDLSQVMFICTANVITGIPPPLRDRLEILRLPGYTLLEKLAIAEKYLLPRQREEHGLSARHLSISAEAITGITEHYTREAGVRGLERELANVCRKVATRVVRDASTRVEIKTFEEAQALLGVPRFRADLAELEPQVGVATGLAWTETGGQVLFVEATRMPGRGKLLVTGQLGDVMQESLQAALSWARARGAALGLDADFFREQDIHVHVPEGGIPKDGPSAGITMATAVVSALTGRPVRHDLAMTGEITLRGRVLPVGGIKEKLLAAHRIGLKDLLLPRANEKDLEDVPAEVRDALHVTFVETVDEVLALALLPAPPPAAGDTSTAANTGPGASP